MFDLSSIGIAWGSVLMLVMMIALLLTGMQLAFVTGFVAIFLHSVAGLGQMHCL